MARLHACGDAELSAELHDQLKSVVPGNKLPDVYRQMANSENALGAYLTMEASVRQSSLSEREVEAIKLAVSELNRCDYCLSVHTWKSDQAGLDRASQLSIRKGEPIGEDRLDMMVRIVRHFFKQPGNLPDALVAEARAAQLTDQNLLDLVLVASTIFLTNTFNHINDTELAFEPAPALDG